MRRRESSDDRDREAARWAARIDSGALTLEQDQELSRWASSDARRAGALARALAVSARCDDALAKHADATPSFRAAAPSQGARRRAFVRGGVAAAVAVVGLCAIGGPWYASHDFQTPAQEVRSFALADGSVMTLNADSRVWVQFKTSERRVKVIRGEAHFEVAKSRSRPFIVQSGDTAVRAVGTAFSVAYRPVDHGTEIRVQEGEVDVADRRRDHAAPVRLVAGCVALASPEGAVSVTHRGPEAVSRALAWRSGMLSFDGVTLAHAAQAFARYNKERIVVDDPTVSRLLVTGLFSAKDPRGFAQAVASSQGLRVHPDPAGIRLSR